MSEPNFEEVLLAWAHEKVRDEMPWSPLSPPVVEIRGIEIKADPGDNRDDSYHEPPRTDIIIDARVDGVWREVRVQPDLLEIVREMTKIARG